MLIGGARHKTLPSKLSGRDLRALLASGQARSAAGWEPDPSPAVDGSAVEVDRTVNPVGYVGLGGDRCNIGWAFVGRRVTLRLDGTVMQVLDEQLVLLAALSCPLLATACGRLCGARPAGPPRLFRCPPHRSLSGPSAATAASPPQASASRSAGPGLARSSPLTSTRPSYRSSTATT